MEEMHIRPALNAYAKVCLGSIAILVALAIGVSALFQSLWMPVMALSAFFSLVIFAKLWHRYYLHISTEYVVNDSEITQISGLWAKNESHVPIDKIEDYKITRSYLGKLLGVANFGIQTARAETGFELVLLAIPEKDVAALDQLLEKLVEKAKP